MSQQMINEGEVISAAQQEIRFIETVYRLHSAMKPDCTEYF